MKTQTVKEKGTHILSLEASKIYDHSVRGLGLEGLEAKDFVGVIPYSLELIKMKSVGMDIFNTKEDGKDLTRDVINVKFEQKVRPVPFKEVDLLPTKIKKTKAELNKNNKELELKNKELEKEIRKDAIKEIKQVINKINKTIISLESRLVKQTALLAQLEKKDSMIDEKWNGMKNDELRKHMYEKGFTIANEDGTFTVYKVYKRSSSKSRTGQCLFIREELLEELILWSRMGLEFDENKEWDFPSILAYESLTGSSLKGTVVIKPKNILIVSDVESVFHEKCNVIRTNEDTKLLESVVDENTKIVNSLFDGESLLQDDSKYFEDGKSMVLLRNFWFKSAAFRCDIRQFLKDQADKKKIDFDKWKITNMFGDKMKASDVELIITPSSLKALKMWKYFGEDNENRSTYENEMFKHWKKVVAKNKNVFGVCKSETEEGRGTFNNEILQRTSYQMINSLPITKQSQIKDLTFIERDYIHNMKTDDQFFINHLEENKNDQNAHEMWVELFKKNSDIAGDTIFRTYRTTEISKYVRNCKRGKIRMIGNYAILLGNPVSFLYHAIGEFDVNNYEKFNLDVKGKTIYTKMFKDGEKLVGMRNPHTEMSNVYCGTNQKVEAIDTYFKNLSKNIVCVSSVKHNCLNIWSGSDFDSDAIVIFNHPTMVSLGKKCQKDYLVSVNDIPSDPRTYLLTKENMAKIDAGLATDTIGKVVNSGQLHLSRYHDLKASGASEDVLKELLAKVSIFNVLSGISIDMTKRAYKINITDEIDHLDKSFELKTNHEGKKKKPNFWQFVSGQNGNAKERREAGKKIKKKIMHYDCPMDMLFREMSKLDKAPDHELIGIELESLLIKRNMDDGNRKQEAKIIDFVDKLADESSHAHATMADTDELNNKLETITKYYNFYVNKSKVKPDSMYAILKHMIKNDYSQKVRLMNTLYKTQKEVFLGAFKAKDSNE